MQRYQVSERVFNIKRAKQRHSQNPANIQDGELSSNIQWLVRLSILDVSIFEKDQSDDVPDILKGTNKDHVFQHNQQIHLVSLVVILSKTKILISCFNTGFEDVFTCWIVVDNLPSFCLCICRLSFSESRASEVRFTCQQTHGGVIIQ